MQLLNRIALVTGGTKGIGAATSLALALEGADVALIARDKSDEAASVLRQIRNLGRKCELILGDVGLPEDVARCVRETTERLGSVDLLVHSAGGSVPGNILDISVTEWQRAFDVHVHAAFHLCRATLPTMRAQKRGSIVLISSAAGLRGCPGHFAYQVVKGSLPQFARALAREFAADNIRVNCVAPGIIRTDFHAPMTAEQKKHNLDNRIPLKREGSAEQVAELIKQLLINDYITGETMTIDGGLTMRIA